MRNYFLKG